MPTDWQELSLTSTTSPAVVDPRRRLRCCLGTFVLLMAVIWCRAAQLEINQGTTFRAEALHPNRREELLPATRGRILARDGAVLACDRLVAAVTVDYRWFEEPPRQAWLEQVARRRLPKDRRRNAALLAEEAQKLRLRARRPAPPPGRAMWSRSGGLAGLGPGSSRTASSGSRPTPGGGRSRHTPFIPAAPATTHRGLNGSPSPCASLQPPGTPCRRTSPWRRNWPSHVLAEDIPAAAVAEIQQHAERFPGTRIVQLGSPDLSGGKLGNAGIRSGVSSRARVTSHHAPVAISSTGIEQQCEAALPGTPGICVEVTNHAGRVQQSYHQSEPIAGHNVTLTIDSRLQRTAEELLDSAVQRAALQSDHPQPSGGAVVVIDVRDGEILAAASTPRFDPAVFVGGDSTRARPCSPIRHTRSFKRGCRWPCRPVRCSRPSPPSPCWNRPGSIRRRPSTARDT